MKLKVEINTREHFSVLGFQSVEYAVDNPWFNGTSKIPTYQAEELLGTKLRALYQRKKGRDLFDAHDGTSVSRAEFEANLFGKIGDPVFLADVPKLLSSEFLFDPVQAQLLIQDAFLNNLSGEPWKGNKKKPDNPQL